MGGVKFFNIVLETADGDLAAMDAVLEGMNAVVDEAAEERKGGAGHLGKMLLSAGDKTVALVCNIPKDLASQYEHVKMSEWMDKLVTAAGGNVAKREEGEETIKVGALMLRCAILSASKLSTFRLLSLVLPPYAIGEEHQIPDLISLPWRA